ncbi:MAG: serine/threonine-protein kinase [Planctomycetota bacterium]
MQTVGPYRIVEELARGGMGVVYRAQGPQGETVALKLLLAHRAQNPQARARFQTEVQALARLRHPGLVSILAAGEHQGTPWLALEFVPGETLAQRLRQGPLTPEHATWIAQDLARALAYVHACGVVHRDLKPDNVLLYGPHPKLTDFGIALDTASDRSRVTATGVFQGTPGFWAPEQAEGAKHRLGPHTDVYGLGAVLFTCLTGRPPVEGQSLPETLLATLDRPIRPPSAVTPGVPAWLDALTLAPAPAWTRRSAHRAWTRSWRRPWVRRPPSAAPSQALAGRRCSPPSLAALAFGLTQLGAALAARRPCRRPCRRTAPAVPLDDRQGPPGGVIEDPKVAAWCKRLSRLTSTASTAGRGASWIRRWRSPSSTTHRCSPTAA